MARIDEPALPESVAAEAELTEAAASQANLAVAPELVADSLGEYLRAWVARIRAGESGVLPVIGGLLLISILFQKLNSPFLTAGNLVNPLLQGSVYMTPAMGEGFAPPPGRVGPALGFVRALA